MIYLVQKGGDTVYEYKVLIVNAEELLMGTGKYNPGGKAAQTITEACNEGWRVSGILKQADSFYDDCVVLLIEKKTD